MAIVAEFTIPPTALPGGKTLEDMPETTIELERIVPTEESVFPFFWLFGEDPHSFLTQIESEPNIDDIYILAEIDQAALFRAVWTPHSDIIQGIRTLRATIMEAVGTSDEWYFQVRAEDRERLLDFQRIFHSRDIPVQLERIYNLSELLESARPLTEEQRETLVVAYRSGYFDQPRQITQMELGEHFDISSQAVADRLKRGMRNLIRNSLVAPDAENGQNRF